MVVTTVGDKTNSLSSVRPRERRWPLPAAAVASVTSTRPQSSTPARAPGSLKPMKTRPPYTSMLSASSSSLMVHHGASQRDRAPGGSSYGDGPWSAARSAAEGAEGSFGDNSGSESRQDVVSSRPNRRKRRVPRDIEPSEDTDVLLPTTTLPTLRTGRSRARTTDRGCETHEDRTGNFSAVPRSPRLWPRGRPHLPRYSRITTVAVTIEPLGWRYSAVTTSPAFTLRPEVVTLLV